MLCNVEMRLLTDRKDPGEGGRPQCWPSKLYPSCELVDIRLAVRTA